MTERGICPEKQMDVPQSYLSDYPLAVYLHCASHTLNLAVVKSLDVQCVRNMIGVVNKVSTFFFAHPKRQRKLEEAIQTTQPTSSILKLKDLCRTRWIERIDALDRFKDLHPSIVACFESISAEGSTNWTSDSLPNRCQYTFASDHHYGIFKCPSNCQQVS